MLLYKVTAHQLDDSVACCIYCNFGAEFVSLTIIRMGLYHSVCAC